MTVDFAKEYLLDDCDDCPENKDGECMTESHCFEVKRMAIQALEQTRWIPVSERLPEIGQRVLVTYNQEDKLKVDTTIFDRHGFLIGVVTAWMPLPPSYKGESEDKE